MTFLTYFDTTEFDFYKGRMIRTDINPEQKLIGRNYYYLKQKKTKIFFLFFLFFEGGWCSISNATFFSFVNILDIMAKVGTKNYNCFLIEITQFISFLLINHRSNLNFNLKCLHRYKMLNNNLQLWQTASEPPFRQFLVGYCIV